MQNTICVNALRHREPVRAERIRCDICVSALRHRRKNPSGRSASDASGMLGGGVGTAWPVALFFFNFFGESYAVEGSFKKHISKL